MATARITNSAIVKAAPGLLWDTEVKGFGVRIGASGTATFVFQYRLGGREATARRHSIGRHGDWTPDEARKEARRLGQMVDRGIDPAEEKQRRRREAVDLAFNKYAEHFAEKYLARKWKRPDDGARLLRAAPVEVLGAKPITKITKADIAAVMDRLDGKQATKRLTFALLRKLLRYAAGRGEIERSPMENMEAPASVAARDVILSNALLADLWSVLGVVGPAGDVYRLLLLTGQRLNEVTRLDWKELDRAAALWTLPSARAKNKAAHTVPLSPQAVAVLDAIAGGDQWPRKGLVFPAATGDGSMWVGDKLKKKLNAKIAALRAKRAGEEGVEPEPVGSWRNHDIRRTVATGMQRLGTRLEVTEAVLNHVSGSRAGVVGVYQRHDWQEEKRAALDAWAMELDRIVSGTQPRGNVVALRA